MPVHLKNLAKYPLSIRCNSGETLILSPGEQSAQLVDAEVQGNVYIQKLKQRGLLELRAVTPKPGKEEEKKQPEKAKSKK